MNYLTGPPVLSEAIEKLYSNLGFDSIYYAKDEDLNSAIRKNSKEYCRFVGTDFDNRNFIFKHPYYNLLYKDKLPWMEEQKIKSAII